jgi:hypothetical protein
VTIDWQDVTAGSAPISVTLSPSDAALTTTIAPDPLAGIVSATKRYFSPAIPPGHACAFIVRLTDSAGQSSATATAGAEGVKFSLSYNANGGSGAAPTSAEYAYGTPVTAASGSGLSKLGRFFGGWNTRADGGGAAYPAGSSIVMNQGNLTLYARWMNTGTENGVTFTISGTAVTDSQGVKYTVTGGTVRINIGNTSAAGNVIIPASIGGYPVTSINLQAFYNCTGLTSITLPDSVTSIGSNVFYGCTALTTVTLPAALTNLPSSTFMNCKNLTTVAIPAGVTTIETNAFYGCTGLTSVSIPAGLKTIADMAFVNCAKLTTITLPEGLTSIGTLAFSGCSGLTAIAIPASLTSIGVAAFEKCTGLAAVTLSEGLTSIANKAFFFCTGLTTITLPASLTSIGDYAFDGCSSLTTLIVNAAAPPPLGTSALRSCPFTQIKVPSASLNTYKTAAGWSAYAAKMVGF